MLMSFIKQALTQVNFHGGKLVICFLHCPLLTMNCHAFGNAGARFPGPPSDSQFTCVLDLSTNYKQFVILFIDGAAGYQRVTKRVL